MGATEARGRSHAISCGCGAKPAAGQSQRWSDFDDDVECVECARSWGAPSLNSCELSSACFSSTSRFARNYLFLFASIGTTGNRAGILQSRTNGVDKRVVGIGQNENISSGGAGHSSKGERSECSLRTNANDREGMNRNDNVTVDISAQAVYAF